MSKTPSFFLIICLIKMKYDKLNSILLEISEQKMMLKSQVIKLKESRITLEQTLLQLEDEKEKTNNIMEELTSYAPAGF